MRRLVTPDPTSAMKVVRHLAFGLLVACHAAAPAVDSPAPAPPPPSATSAPEPPVPVTVAEPAEAGPPTLTAAATQIWRLGDVDVVAEIPTGAREPRPIVVGIHGSKDTPAAACARWRRSLAGYAFVVCPAGVPYRGGLAWGAPSVMITRIDAALAAVRERFPAFVAPGPAIYAGWSLGGTRGPGVVALRPGAFEPVILAEAGHTRLDATASAKSLRTGKTAHVIVACATKRCAGFGQRLARASKTDPSVISVDAGIGRGHVFDDRMAKEIGRAVVKATDGDPRWSGLAAALAAPAADVTPEPLPEDDEGESL